MSSYEKFVKQSALYASYQQYNIHLMFTCNDNKRNVMSCLLFLLPVCTDSMARISHYKWICRCVPRK